MRVLLIICLAASAFGQKSNLPPDIDAQSNSRLPLIQRDQLNEADRKVFDDVANTAPGRVSMYSPPIAVDQHNPDGSQPLTAPERPR